MKKIIFLVLTALAGLCTADDSPWQIGIGVGKLELRLSTNQSWYFEKDSIWEFSMLRDLSPTFGVELKTLHYAPPDMHQYGSNSGFKLDSLMLSLRFHPCVGSVCPYLAGGLNGTRAERWYLEVYPGAVKETVKVTHLGWQAAGGLDVKINNSFTAYAEYMYLHSAAPSLSYEYWESPIRADIVTIGVRYRF